MFFFYFANGFVVRVISVNVIFWRRVEAPALYPDTIIRDKLSKKKKKVFIVWC